MPADDALKTRIAECLRGTQPAADPEAAVRAAWPPEVAALFRAPLIAAAVLVPLVERPSGMTVLLTRRMDNLRDHPGQISFPGGRLVAAGESALAAALRETTEELGIPAHAVEVAGYLPPQPVVTGFIVTPVVGFLPDTIDPVPDPTEVAEVFEVPLDFVLDPANASRSWRRIQGVDLPVWEYRHGGRRIWGATAAILSALRVLIT